MSDLSTKPHVLYFTWITQDGSLRLIAEGPGADRFGGGGCASFAPARYEAHAAVGGEIIFGRGTTRATAIRALEHQIDRRSIGLFGVDDVVFETDPGRFARHAADRAAQKAAA